jgi:hypothetical protein
MAKIVFSTKQGQKTISLPSFEGSEVVIQVAKATVKEERDAMKATADIVDKEDRGFAIMTEKISKGIVSWNFTDEEGKDLAITKEIIEDLPTEDFMLLVKEITGIDPFSADAKKKEPTQ